MGLREGFRQTCVLSLLDRGLPWARMPPAHAHKSSHASQLNCDLIQQHKTGPGPRFRRIPRDELERLNHAANGIVGPPVAPPPPPPPPPEANAAPQDGGGSGGMGAAPTFDAMARRADARWEAVLGPGVSLHNSVL